MTVKAWLARHLAAACVLGAASIASAQITTGTITGTVRDGQGGVIPGATVVLTSDTQGTKSSPVVTNATGDFVFVNLRADTYTIEVTMPSFNTLTQSQVTPGSTLGATYTGNSSQPYLDLTMMQSIVPVPKIITPMQQIPNSDRTQTIYVPQINLVTPYIQNLTMSITRSVTSLFSGWPATSFS